MSYHKSYAGAGWVSIVPGGTNPDPIHLAEIDGFEVNVNEDDVDLENADGDVIDSYTSKRVIEGSISLKDVSNSLLAAVTNGVTVGANRPIGYSHTASIPTTPFTITAPLTNPTRTFGADLGVIDLTSGKAMTCAVAAATGVYALNTGTGAYTFDTTDSGHNVLINYRATPQTADGTTADIAVATSSSQTKYGLHFYGTKAGKSFGFYIPAARIPGISMKFSKGGWADVTLKWKATADSANKLIYSYLTE